MALVISVINGKGGSGKSTTALAVAAVFAEERRVLLIDADPQGSSTWATELAAEAVYDLALESDPATLAKLRSVAAYDVLVADTPPALTNDAVEALAKASDFVILPTSPSALDLRELTRTIAAVIKPLGVRYRVLLNRVDSRRLVEVTQVKASLGRAGIRVFDDFVRSRVALERFIVEGQPLTTYGGAGGKAALVEYRRIVAQLLSDLAEGGDEGV